MANVVKGSTASNFSDRTDVLLTESINRSGPAPSLTLFSGGEPNPQTFEIKLQSDRSIVSRFFSEFFRGFWDTMREKITDIAIVVLTLIYWLVRHKFSEHLWESLAPWVWAISLIVVFHAFKAAKNLCRKRQSKRLAYGIRAYAIALSITLLAILGSFLVYHKSQRESPLQVSSGSPQANVANGITKEEVKKDVNEAVQDAFKQYKPNTEKQGISDTVTATVKRATPHPSPTFVEEEGPFTILFGSGNISLGNDQKQTNLIIDGHIVVAKAYVEKQKLYVDATLSDGSSSPPVELKHNRLTFQNQRWDRNYDGSALEIVNENLIPIFQVIYRNPRTAIVRGIFFDRGNVIVADEQGITVNPPPDSAAVFKRIFKYPSRLYQGQELEGDHR